MRKKCNILSLCSFIVSFVIFAFTYYLYHYVDVDCRFVPEFHDSPGKPFITLLFGVWGVMFLFSGVMSFLVGRIFFKKE